MAAGSCSNYNTSVDKMAASRSVYQCNGCEFIATSYSGLVRHRNRNRCTQTNPVNPSDESDLSILEQLLSSGREDQQERKREPTEDEEEDDVPCGNLDLDGDFNEQTDPAVADMNLESQAQADNTIGLGDDLQLMVYFERQMQSMRPMPSVQPTSPSKQKKRQKTSTRKVKERGAALAFAKLVGQLGLHSRKINLLLAALHSGQLDVAYLPKTYTTWKQRVTETFVTNNSSLGGFADGEKTVSLSIAEVNEFSPTVNFVMRSHCLTAAIKLLLDSSVCHPSKLVWKHRQVLVPRRRRRRRGSRNTTTTSMQVQVSHGCTAKYWKQIETQLQPGCLPLVVKAFSDATGHGKSGSVHTMMITLGNFPGYVQRSVRGKSPVGYIPKVEGALGGPDKLAKARLRVFQQCYAAVIEHLTAANGRVIPLMLNGEVVYLQVFVSNLILDGPEAKKAAGVRSSCIRCMRTRADMAALGRKDPPRMQADMVAVVDRCEEMIRGRRNQRDGTMGRVQEQLDSVNIHFYRLALWDLPTGTTGGVYDCISTDRLHLIKGLSEDHKAVLEYILRQECPNENSDSYLETKYSLIDRRMARIPTFMSATMVLPRFATGFYSKHQLEAWHFSAWITLIPFCICDDIILDEQTRCDFLTVIEQFRDVDWPMYTFNSFDEEQIADLDKAIKIWRRSFKEKFSDASKSKLAKDNFHKVEHVPECIERDGPPANTCCGSFEQAHAPLSKLPASFTNNRSESGMQMMRQVRQTEDLQRGHEDWRSFARSAFRYCYVSDRWRFLTYF
jgi:hypothetical protein